MLLGLIVMWSGPAGTQDPQLAGRSSDLIVEREGGDRTLADIAGEVGRSCLDQMRAGDRQRELIGPVPGCVRGDDAAVDGIIVVDLDLRPGFSRA